MTTTPTPDPALNGQTHDEPASDNLGKPETFRADLTAHGPTDDGVARIVASNLSGRILSAPKTSELFVWDRSRWRLDDVAAAKALIREECVQLISDEHSTALVWADRVNKIGDKTVTPNDYPNYKKMKTYLAKARQEAVTSFTKEDPRLTVPVSDFDNHPDLLATPTATINLKTGEVSSPNPADKLTQRTNVSYNPGAEAPRFMRFLDEITDDDKDLKQYLQTVLGYALTGSYRTQELYIWQGDGANGKDTLLEAVEGAGGDYVARGVENMLIEKKHDKHLAEVYILRGKRLVVHSESNRGNRLNLGRVKQWTGTPNITANAMRQNPVTFPNTWTHILMTNQLPTVQGDDYGTLRRIVVVPFPATFWKGNEPDYVDGAPVMEPGLGAYLAEIEAEGILAWLIEGAGRFYQEGEKIEQPAAVREATNEYHSQIADAHGVHQFVNETCVPDKTESAPFGDLYSAYEVWAKINDKDPAGKATFGRKLTGLGYQATKTRVDGHSTRCRQGIRIRTDAISQNTANIIFEAVKN